MWWPRFCCPHFDRDNLEPDKLEDACMLFKTTQNFVQPQQRSAADWEHIKTNGMLQFSGTWGPCLTCGNMLTEFSCWHKTSAERRLQLMHQKLTLYTFAFTGVQIYQHSRLRKWMQDVRISAPIKLIRTHKQAEHAIANICEARLPLGPKSNNTIIYIRRHTTTWSNEQQPIQRSYMRQQMFCKDNDIDIPTQMRGTVCKAWGLYMEQSITKRFGDQKSILTLQSGSTWHSWIAGWPSD